MKKIACIFLAILLTSCGDTTPPVEAPIVENIPEIRETVSSDEVSETTSETDEEIIEEPVPTTRALPTPSQPSFSEVALGFSHNFDKDSSLPFLGGAFFDLDSDGKNEFIITGGAGQNDGIFRYENGSLIDLTTNSGISNTTASYGAYSIDFDGDTTDDLFIARQDGIYFYKNIGGTMSEQKLNITLPQNAVPLDIDLADIDSDGDLDMYVSTFIKPSLFRAAVFNDPTHVQKNLLLRNDGNLSFSDITSESGLEVVANTFTSNFADLDGDNDPDIVISPNTDSVKIFKNDGGNFSKVYEGEIHGFWMGLAVNDYDNDGDEDMFFSGVGTSIPERLIQGDSNSTQNVKARYLFLENNGDMTFKEKREDSFDTLGFGWGIVPTDFNLDTKSDFLIMQNYIKWAPHKLSKLPGEMLVQSANKSFIPKISDYNLSNKNYGISALVGDLNSDGLDDVIYLNLNGASKAHIRQNDGTNNFLKVLIPNDPQYLYAQIELKAGEEVLHTQQFLPKQGLLTKQESSMIFGLNTQENIPTSLTISMQDGSVETRELTPDDIIIKL